MLTKPASTTPAGYFVAIDQATRGALTAHGLHRCLACLPSPVRLLQHGSLLRLRPVLGLRTRLRHLGEDHKGQSSAPGRLASDLHNTRRT